MIDRGRPWRHAAAAGWLAGAIAAIAASLPAAAVSLSTDELTALCAQADGPAHCGRLVEAFQLKRLPNLATRDGPTLKVSLYPAGVATFGDTESLHGGRSYSLWDYFDPINAVLLYVVDGEDGSFVLLHRPTAQKVGMPAEPQLSPDRQRLVTADFCATHCVNEVALWRVDRNGVRKEASWRPTEVWEDATAIWRDAQTILLDVAPKGGAREHRERRVDAADWRREGAP